MAQPCVEPLLSVRLDIEPKLSSHSIYRSRGLSKAEHIQAVFHASKKWNAKGGMSGRAISCMKSTAGQPPGQTSQSQQM